jgi:hypothetical protein
MYLPPSLSIHLNKKKEYTMPYASSKTLSDGPSFQRCKAGPVSKKSTSKPKAVGKAPQFNAKSMANKYEQKVQKSSSARITGTTWG